MNQHNIYATAQEQGNYHDRVLFRVQSSELTSFLYQVVCHWNKLALEINQCPSKDTFKYQVKCILYSRLFVQETSLYVSS